MRFFILLLISITNFFYSQQKETPLIMFQYHETENQASPVTNNYIGTVFFKGDISYYKSEYKNSEANNNGVDDNTILIKELDVLPMNEIITNRKTKELVESRYESKFVKKSYSVSEDYPQFKWTILPGKRMIKNMECKSASTTFRGRKYVAWYSEKYPINVGPWKFNGLPGLIISVEDSEGVYKWNLTTIQSPYRGNTNNINLEEAFSKRYKYPKLSYQEFDKKFVNAIKNKIELVRARNSTREGMRGGFSFSTEYEKEPVNEWRKQNFFD